MRRPVSGSPDAADRGSFVPAATALFRGLAHGALLGIASIASAAAATIHFFEFENSFANSVSGAQPATTLAGSPGFSSNAPTAILGLGNAASLQLGAADALSFAFAFPFNSLADATLEFFVNPAAVVAEQDLFWTTTGPGDTNRFNIGLFGPGVFIDYRSSSGSLHSLGFAATGLTANQWNFVAIVKRGDTYAIHINDIPPVVNIDSNPSLPTSTAWTMNGRAFVGPTPGVQFSGLIDAIRISDRALSPSEFLYVGKIFRDGFESN